MNGREGFIRIGHVNGKTSEVLGTRFGNWAATIMTAADFNAWRSVHGDDANPDPDYECWTVTHVPSGRSVKSQRWLLRDEAEACARLLAKRYPSGGLTKRGLQSKAETLDVGMFERDAVYIAESIFGEALGEACAACRGVHVAGEPIRGCVMR